jgi:glycosyltransferase involved in cell wall biosynthesis
MARPLISVVVPTYERTAFIGDTLDSVLTQTFTDYEVIVVEDGSRTIAEVIGKYRDRVDYVWQENQGVGAARNAGAARARGEWLAFVDDDDLWLPEKLERQLCFAEANPEMGLIHTDHYVLDGEKIIVPPRRPARERTPSGWVTADIFLNNFIIMSSTMVRKSAFAQEGGFSATSRYAEDHDLWLRLSRRARIGFVPEFLTIYRDHDRSKSSQLAWHFARARVLEDFLAATPSLWTECGTGRVRRHLRDAFWSGGYTHLIHERYPDARRLFSRAWSWAPWDPTPLLYAGACLGGERGFRALRALKRMVG